MAFEERTFAQTTISSTTAQVVYTSPSSTKSILQSLRLSNPTSSTVQVRVFFSQLSSTLSQSTTFQPLYSLAAYSSLIIDKEKITWDTTATGTLGVQCGTSAVLNVFAFGAEIV